jgi:chromosome segregation ATPase
VEIEKLTVRHELEEIGERCGDADQRLQTLQHDLAAIQAAVTEAQVEAMTQRAKRESSFREAETLRYRAEVLEEELAWKREELEGGQHRAIVVAGTLDRAGIDARDHARLIQEMERKDADLRQRLQERRAEAERLQQALAAYESGPAASQVEEAIRDARKVSSDSTQVLRSCSKAAGF